MIRPTPSIVFTAFIACAGPGLAQDGDQSDAGVAHLEVRDDAPLPGARETTAAGGFRVGPYTSVQVNVDSNGNNISGDAANEPSIAVDPNDHDRMVAGWRQFDSVQSNFRQAGWAYSHDGGQSWTFPDVIDRNQFRSDPVVDADSSGVFYYHSLTDNSECDVFRSTDGGVSWDSGTDAFGGDKNWLVVDRTGGQGDGHVYAIWQRFFNCCNEDTFTRSADGGNSFETPIEIPDHPTFGVLDVASNGDVWAAGIEANNDQNFRQFVVARSTDSDDAGQTPSFTTVDVDLGGRMRFGTGPNPGGLLGQAYVRADPSDPDRAYALCAVDPRGSEPMDVMLARSEDGGQSWSAPIRVNQDPENADNWQWMGTLSVSPLGRLDAVWNDDRNSGGPSNLTETFYAWSWDHGETWTEARISPQWDSHVGWPNQQKIGDYYDLRSDDAGADLIYATTVNGEQDVYYARLFPDCNDNAVSDVTDIRTGTSFDVDGDWIPDECEALTAEVDDDTPDLGQSITVTVCNGLPGSLGLLFLVEFDGVSIRFKLTNLHFDNGGEASFTGAIPNNGALSGKTFSLDSIALFLDGDPALSNVVQLTIQ